MSEQETFPGEHALRRAVFRLVFDAAPDWSPEQAIEAVNNFALNRECATNRYVYSLIASALAPVAPQRIVGPIDGKAAARAAT